MANNHIIMKTITRVATNLMTGASREIAYTRVENHNFGINPLYLTSDGDYYTFGILGWFCVNKYINQLETNKKSF